MARRQHIRAPRKRCTAKEVDIYGHRDPRGPDNTVSVWVDAADRLHIRVLKPDRCYRFERVIENQSFIEVVQI